MTLAQLLGFHCKFRKQLSHKLNKPNSDIIHTRMPKAVKKLSRFFRHLNFEKNLFFQLANAFILVSLRYIYYRAIPPGGSQGYDGHGQELVT